jgi:hypothetical protein
MRQPPEKPDRIVDWRRRSPAREQRGRASAGAIAVDELVPVVQLGQVLAGRVGVGFRVGKRALEGAQLRVAVEYEFDRRCRRGRSLLRDVRDYPRRRQRDFACVGVELAPQEREQRRLAAAVGADQPDFLPRVHHQGRVFEQALVTPGEREAAEADH